MGKAWWAEGPAIGPSVTTAVAPRATAVPWFVRAVLVASTSAVVGVIWDISWHRSIGRDTFWTPAHVAIQLCGVLAGISCGHLILWTTFARAAPLREASVSILGLRGPLGAFIAHVSGADFFGLVVSVLVIAYLFYALIRGEKL